jgi:hypothetical protein
MTCTEVALKCVEFDRHKRPNIVDIINKLDEIETTIGKVINHIIISGVNSFFGCKVL